MKPSNYYLIRWEGQVRLSLLPMGQVLDTLTDPVAAANAYARNFSRTFFLEKEKIALVRQLERRRQQTENYIAKTFGRLEALDADRRPEELANLIMANLHQIAPRAESVRLYDFYRDAEVDIRLKPQLSPQKNAEQYYRKAKNQQIEKDQLWANLARKQAEAAALDRHLEAAAHFDNVKELRQYLKAHGLRPEGSDGAEVTLPFRRFEVGEFEVWVGKNARSNDELTQRYAYKEDLWLHARDVSGSHVLLKYRAGKAFPPAVVERAAQLAAYYSKRKQDTLCPVICTPRKFVRKVKGAPPGSVVVEREEVLMVTPQSPAAD